MYYPMMHYYDVPEGTRVVFAGRPTELLVDVRFHLVRLRPLVLL